METLRALLVAAWPLVAALAAAASAVAITRAWRHERGLAVRAERDACAELAEAVGIPPEYSGEQREVARAIRSRIARAIRGRGVHLVRTSSTREP